MSSKSYLIIGYVILMRALLPKGTSLTRKSTTEWEGPAPFKVRLLQE